MKYIKKTTQTLKDQYDGDIPDSVDKLCELTGVGPKMAHICMKTAWNKVTGIGKITLQLPTYTNLKQLIVYVSWGYELEFCRNAIFGGVFFLDNIYKINKLKNLAT